jgi:hypothetical protein
VWKRGDKLLGKKDPVRSKFLNRSPRCFEIHSHELVKEFTQTEE